MKTPKRIRRDRPSLWESNSGGSYVWYSEDRPVEFLSPPGYWLTLNAEYRFQAIPFIKFSFKQLKANFTFISYI